MSSDFSTLLNKVHLDESPGFLSNISDNSISLTITSPPYYDDDLYVLDEEKLEFGWKTYGDYLQHLDDLLKELFRVTIPSGKIVLVLSNSPQTDKDEQITHYWPIIHDVVVQSKALGWQMFDEVIWVKPADTYPYINHSKIPETTSRVHHDIITILRKPGSKRAGVGKHRVPSVWEMPAKGPITSYNKAYPSFPDELIRKSITAWSLPNDIVLDPYAGSGQVIRIAMDMDRFAIGVEIDQQWQKLWKDINYD